MPYHPTTIGQLPAFSSRLDFEKIVSKYKGDFRVRKLTCRSQFIHMLFTQLGDRNSLRDTIDGSRSQGKKLYHPGCRHIILIKNKIVK